MSDLRVEEVLPYGVMECETGRVEGERLIYHTKGTEDVISTLSQSAYHRGGLILMSALR